MLRNIVPPVLSVTVFLLVWQAACKMFSLPPYMLPDPLRVAERMAEDSSLLLKHVAATFQLALMGVAAGVAAGIIVALILHFVPWLRSAVAPLIVMSQNIPLIVLAPLLIMWFGFGLSPKLILLVIICFFPIAWSMLAGLRHAEPHLREYLAMIGASRRQMLLRLELPASLPYFFSGLKITTTYSVSSVVVAEWLGSSKGIGYYLYLKFKGYDIAAAFGAVACIIALSLLFYGAAALLERLVIRWRPRTGEKGGRQA
ncbi:ABC transporter permease [Cohnella kolymensis]|nr:ABC transporter permease [Cohnella kolymensis]